MSPKSLSSSWRSRADGLRSLGAEAQARTMEILADELEQTQREWELEALTLEQAVEESGFSYSSLQKKVAAGELSNIGEKGKPRIRRCEIPKKGGRQELVVYQSDPDLADEMLLERLAG